MLTICPLPFSRPSEAAKLTLANISAMDGVQANLVCQGVKLSNYVFMSVSDLQQCCVIGLKCVNMFFFLDF